MKWICLIACLSSTPALHAQTPQIKELKFRPSPKFYDTRDSTIVYPVIVTAHPSISQLINKDIESTILEFDPDDHIKTTRDEIRSMIKMGLTDMSYEATYNRNGILSLKIDLTVEAAYPNESEFYLNFDVRTGQSLEIKDVLNDSLFGQFRSKVFADKVDSLKKYKEDLRIQLTNDQIDSTTYQWAIEVVDSSCINSVDINSYSLSRTGIKIGDHCAFPHAIRGDQPGYELMYSYEFMLPYLKPEFRARLVPPSPELNSPKTIK